MKRSKKYLKSAQYVHYTFLYKKTDWVTNSSPMEITIVVTPIKCPKFYTFKHPCEKF